MSAASIETKTITCPDGMTCFLAYPEGQHSVVVLLHERYGLVQHTRDLAIRAAKDGYFVVAPNLFFRHPDQAALNSGKSRYALSDPEAVENLAAAVAAARNHPHADISRIAVAGYCQTGRHPLVFAATVPITAAIVWYGAAAKREWEMNEPQPEPLDRIIARVPCPIFGAFGSDDHIISLEDVQHFRAALETHRKSYDIRIYAGAPHGWLNDTMPGRYRERQANEAWTAQQLFLKQVMSGAFAPNSIHWRFESEIPGDYDFGRNRRLE